MSLRLLVDSADPEIWERCRDRGWAVGATTNPKILRRDGWDVNISTYEKLAEQAQRVGLEELHIQATGSTANALAETGFSIADLWDRIRVKVPLTVPGLEAAKRLSDTNVPLTLTAAYATHQMIAAVTLGAAYIAPYYGRLLEADRDGDGILEGMRGIGERFGADTRILVACIRSVDQFEHLIGLGFDTFTLPPAVAETLATDPMSDAAAADFEKAVDPSG